LFSLELNKINAKIISIKRNLNNWIYKIDFNCAKMPYTKKILLNEKLSLKKPLKPYFIEIIGNEPKEIIVISKKLNRWFPKILFFDKNLRLLKTIEKKRYYLGLTANLPKNVKYIKIDDKYSLLNLKRGLSVIVKGN